MPEITAELHNIEKVYLTLDNQVYCYWGQIYQDKLQRWADGRWVKTSRVLKEEGDLIYTVNSIYKKVQSVQHGVLP